MRKQYQIRINDEERDKLRALAKAWKCSEAEVVRRLIMSASLEAHEEAL